MLPAGAPGPSGAPGLHVQLYAQQSGVLSIGDGTPLSTTQLQDYYGSTTVATPQTRATTPGVMPVKFSSPWLCLCPADRSVNDHFRRHISMPASALVCWMWYMPSYSSLLSPVSLGRAFRSSSSSTARGRGNSKAGHQQA